MTELEGALMQNYDFCRVAQGLQILLPDTAAQYKFQSTFYSTQSTTRVGIFHRKQMLFLPDGVIYFMLNPPKLVGASA